MEIVKKIKKWILPTCSFIKIWAPITISILALLHSMGILSTFDTHIYIDSYLLPKISNNINISNTSFPIGLPIVFTNKGSRNGIIEDIILIIKNTKTNEKMLYTPWIELDFQNYTKGKLRLDQENIEAPDFYKFNLKGKESIIKTYIFTQSMSAEHYPFIPTKTGEYKIQIYLKTNGKYDKSSEFLMSFDIDDYNKNGSIYTGRIHFPYDTFKIN